VLHQRRAPGGGAHRDQVQAAPCRPLCVDPVDQRRRATRSGRAWCRLDSSIRRGPPALDACRPTPPIGTRATCSTPTPRTRRRATSSGPALRTDRRLGRWPGVQTVDENGKPVVDARAKPGEGEGFYISRTAGHPGLRHRAPGGPGHGTSRTATSRATARATRRSARASSSRRPSLPLIAQPLGQGLAVHAEPLGGAPGGVRRAARVPTLR